MKILVYHAYYGCDTGCCGHRIEYYPGDNDECYQDFDFGHARSDENIQEYGKRLAEQFLKYHHPKCLETIDWSTLKVDAISWDKCLL